jgi:hypothetical protein
LRDNNGKNSTQYVESSRYSLEETERRLEENEQFIIDLLSRTQPHHDHSYTTIFGKKKSFNSIEFLSASDEEIEEEDDENVKFYCGREIIRPKRIAEPMFFPLLSLGADFRSLLEGCLAFNLLTDESFSSPDSCSILSLLSSVNSLFISDEPSIVLGMLSYLLAFNAVNLFTCKSLILIVIFILSNC